MSGQKKSGQIKANKMLAQLSLVGFLTLFAYQAAIADSSRARISFENIPVSASEDMGVLGTHYDIKPFNGSDVYFGVGGYGALTGDRGGFFTGGITLGHHYFLNDNIADGLAIDTGLFAGGGGGAGAFPGGGLMLRPHLMLEKELDDFSLRLGVSRTLFPNTTNTRYENDTHPSIGIAIPTYQFNNSSAVSSNSYKQNRVTKIVPVSMRYHPDKNAKKRSGDNLTNDITLLGFQYQNFINDSLYRTFETYGAGMGGTDGYAKVLAGFGVNKELIKDSVALDLSPQNL